MGVSQVTAPGGLSCSGRAVLASQCPNGEPQPSHPPPTPSTCLKSQVVDLKAEGYWEELMDTTRPDIKVKDWFAARPDCGSKYQLCVQLLSSAHAPLGTFQPDPATIQQKSDAKWREVSHTFSNYPPGVRYIWFQHGGVDTHYWAGWYGPRVTNSSITIGPPAALTPPNPHPQNPDW